MKNSVCVLAHSHVHQSYLEMIRFSWTSWPIYPLWFVLGGSLKLMLGITKSIGMRFWVKNSPADGSSIPHESFWLHAQVVTENAVCLPLLQRMCWVYFVTLHASVWLSLCCALCVLLNALAPSSWDLEIGIKWKAKDGHFGDVRLAMEDFTIRFFMCDCRHRGADLGLGPAEDKHMASCTLWVRLNQIQAIDITGVPSNLVWTGEKAASSFS